MLEGVQIAIGDIGCTGRSRRVSHFYFEALLDARPPIQWEFKVWPDQGTFDAGLQPGVATIPFLLHLVLLDDERLRVKMIDDNKQAWAMKKGIGPALLVKARDITGKRIVSSVRSDPSSAERREDDAEEMWQKMVCRGQAVYLESEDRFEVLPTRQLCGPDSGGPMDS